MKVSRPMLAAALLVVPLFLARPARADAEESSILDAGDGWYGKLGVQIGTPFARDRGTGLVVGGVFTAVWLKDMRWYGVQADLMMDTNGDASTGARWSLGPEIGDGVVGGDISYFGERIDGDTRHGVAVRGKLTIGFLAVYLRYGHVFADGDTESVEAGLQIKFPLFYPPPASGSSGDD